jgi:hypothetical protein
MLILHPGPTAIYPRRASSFQGDASVARQLRGGRQHPSITPATRSMGRCFGCGSSRIPAGLQQSLVSAGVPMGVALLTDITTNEN